ncbi:MAG TPA: divalent metal cation transporter, partial [Gemmatimonadaceae bacterium]|nr:divalent metal cation transporter [Gemmatimonadaceae bacterium]
MKKILQLALGIVTSVGGFLEIGSIATAAQAGAGFGYQLVWSVVLGTICIAFLVEMSGRCAAVSKHTIPDAMRERFGARFYAVPLIVMLGVSLLVLAAELGGVAAALQLATGISIPAWAIPVLLVAWALLWYTNFSVIENGVSLLGLVTIAFAVGAAKLHPNYGSLLHGTLPTLPREKPSQYWFVAVSVLGASISPYLYYFYSSGAIEEKWDESYVGMNRAIAALGMGFGGFLSIAVLVLAAILFHPRGIDV